MRFSEWIKASPGRATAAAEFFRVSASAISQWARDGVPVGRMKAVRSFTGGEVTLDDMVPEAAEPAEAVNAG
jgi:DNA-binding transcriptional regulator YdaS (Cro superfamily)